MRRYRPSPLTEKPAAEMTDVECRKEYAEIRKRWGYGDTPAKRQQFNAAIEARLSNEITPPSPRAWLLAARDHSETCGKCQGSGRYVWGPVVNGRPTREGTCFACQGEGAVNDADRRRNWGYWMFYVRIDT